MFRQCLFRVEIQQNCELNSREIKLQQQKKDAEERLKKIIAKQGVDGLSFELQASMKKEIELIAKELDNNTRKKKI